MGRFDTDIGVPVSAPTSALRSSSGKTGAVDCDDAWPRMTRSLQGFLEELLGRDRVSLSGKPEVDCRAGGIDGTIQVPPARTLANVRFVDPPGAVGWFQFSPASLVQFGRERCTRRQIVVWSAGRPRSVSNSSTSRYESENRRYQRTAQTMISGSKCLHLNSAGHGLIMESTAAYQIG